MPSDKERFWGVMTALGEVFDAPPSEMKMGLYWDALADLGIDRLEVAAKRIMRERGTASFPKPAELRQAVEGTPTDQASKAAAAVYRAIHEVGHAESVKFDDPLIHAVIDRMGGWIEVCTTVEWQYGKHEFIKLYEAMRKDPPQPIPYLVGLTEADNRKTFPEWVKPPIRISMDAQVDRTAQLAWTAPKQLTEGA